MSAWNKGWNQIEFCSTFEHAFLSPQIETKVVWWTFDWRDLFWFATCGFCFLLNSWNFMEFHWLNETERKTGRWERAAPLSPSLSPPPSSPYLNDLMNILEPRSIQVSWLVLKYEGKWLAHPASILKWNNGNSSLLLGLLGRPRLALEGRDLRRRSEEDGKQYQWFSVKIVKVSFTSFG